MYVIKMKKKRRSENPKIIIIIIIIIIKINILKYNRYFIIKIRWSRFEPRTQSLQNGG